MNESHVAGLQLPDIFQPLDMLGQVQNSILMTRADVDAQSTLPVTEGYLPSFTSALVMSTCRSCSRGPCVPQFPTGLVEPLLKSITRSTGAQIFGKMTVEYGV